MERVRAIALEAGADDVGAVSLEHPDLAEERPHVLRALPGARSLVSIVVREHADDVRSPSRSVANLEFHRAGHEVDEIARRIAVAIAATGHRAINPSTNAQAFFRSLPLVFQRTPAKGWSAPFHFDLTGEHAVRATVRIDDGTLAVASGLAGDADVRVNADGALWLDIVSKKKSAVFAVITGRLKIRGDRTLLDRFAACFPRWPKRRRRRRP